VCVRALDGDDLVVFHAFGRVDVDAHPREHVRGRREVQRRPLLQVGLEDDVDAAERFGDLIVQRDDLAEIAGRHAESPPDALVRSSPDADGLQAVHVFHVRAQDFAVVEGVMPRVLAERDAEVAPPL
jgi:hypothetical protein